LKLPQSGKIVANIIEEDCTKRKVKPIELKDGSQKSRVSQTRASIAYRSFEEFVCQVQKLPGT